MFIARALLCSTAFNRATSKFAFSESPLLSPLSDPAAGKAFGEGTPEFEEGVDKIPRELLKLFESQFGSRPQALVRGALRFVGRGEEPEGASQTEDSETMRELEEEESE